MKYQLITQTTLGILYFIDDISKYIKKIGKKKMIFNDKFSSEEGLVAEGLRMYFTAISWPLFLTGFAIYKTSNCFKKKIDKAFWFWLYKDKC